MEIAVIGAAGLARLERFQHHAQEQGSKVHRLLPGAALPYPDQVLQGVVFFDGGLALPETVAAVQEQVRFLSVPLLVVLAGSTPDQRERLQAASAGASYLEDRSDADILVTLTARCEAQPVPGEVREQLVEPFISAATLSAHEWAGTDAGVQAVYQRRSQRTFGDRSAVLRFTSETLGALVLSFPNRTAASLAKRALVEVTEVVDEALINDCLGEITNVIAGQAKALFLGTPHHFLLSTPLIVSGPDHEVLPESGQGSLVVVFISDLGEFALQLCLKA